MSIILYLHNRYSAVSRYVYTKQRKRQCYQESNQNYQSGRWSSQQEWCYHYKDGGTPGEAHRYGVQAVSQRKPKTTMVGHFWKIMAAVLVILWLFLFTDLQISSVSFKKLCLASQIYMLMGRKFNDSWFGVIISKF